MHKRLNTYAVDLTLNQVAALNPSVARSLLRVGARSNDIITTEVAEKAFVGDAYAKIKTDNHRFSNMKSAVTGLVGAAGGMALGSTVLLVGGVSTLLIPVLAGAGLCAVATAIVFGSLTLSTPGVQKSIDKFRSGIGQHNEPKLSMMDALWSINATDLKRIAISPSAHVESLLIIVGELEKNGLRSEIYDSHGSYPAYVRVWDRENQQALGKIHLSADGQYLSFSQYEDVKLNNRVERILRSFTKEYDLKRIGC